MTWVLDGKPLRSVLVTRLRYLGDVVMSTVVTRALKRGDPQLRLGFLCEDRYAAVLDGQQDLDRLHSLRVERRGPDSAARRVPDERVSAGRSLVGTVAELRSSGYDLAVDLFFNPRSCLLLRAAGIPARFGGARSWRSRLYTHTVGPADLETDASRWQTLAPGGLGDHLSRLGPLRHRETGLPFAGWLAADRNAGPLLPRLYPPAGGWDGNTGLSAVGVTATESYLVLCPGATWPVKEWPVRRWRRLIRWLVLERSEKIVVLVPPGREETWRTLGEEIPPDRGGTLPPLGLPPVLGVLTGAAGVVSVDGGVMHASVALGIPTVALFGATEPAIWFPYGHDRRFRVLAHSPPCHPCHLHRCRAFSCLPAITPAEVAKALAEVLSAASGPERGAHPGVEPGSTTQANKTREDSQ